MTLVKDKHHGYRHLYHNARRVSAPIFVVRRRAGFDRRGGGATVQRRLQGSAPDSAPERRYRPGLSRHPA
jgi:hypothetical protein